MWIYYSLWGLVALWLGDYIKKLVLSKWVNKEVFLLVCFLLYVPLFFVYDIFFWEMLFPSSLLWKGVVMWILDFGIPLGMLTTLKYLNVSFALVSIRLVSSFVLLFIGMFVLQDNLSLYNIVWFLLGAFAIYLLSWYNSHQKLEFPKKGVIALIITTICIILSHSFLKYVVADINIPDFMFLKFSVTFLCILLYMFMRKKFIHLTQEQLQKSLPYAWITAILFWLHFLYFLPNIYLFWPLSLGYKMISYSLIVPILLSVIFLKEPIDKTRILAFGLTLISIFLFI